MDPIIQIDKEEVKEEVNEEVKETERHYLHESQFKLDWSMLLYTPEQEDEDTVIDWNKLVYNEEQYQEFVEKKRRQVFRTEMIDFLYKPFHERTDEEKFFLKEAGYCIYSEEGDGELLCGNDHIEMKEIIEGI